MKNLLVILALALLALFVAPDLFAQPGLPANPTQAPIDGGLSLVALAGGAYAYKKYRDAKKRDDIDA